MIYRFDVIGDELVEKKPFKVYIAGKITGYPNYKENFKICEDYYKKNYPEAIILTPTWMPQGLAPREYMKICFSMIDVADVVIFLENWNDSEGAKLEWQYCQYINKPILYFTGEPNV